MAQKLLQRFRLHTGFNTACGIGMPEAVHTESFYIRLATELIKLCIIGTVFIRHTCAEIDKDKVAHVKLLLLFLIFSFVRIF